MGKREILSSIFSELAPFSSEISALKGVFSSAPPEDSIVDELFEIVREALHLALSEEREKRFESAKTLLLEISEQEKIETDQTRTTDSLLEDFI